MSKSTSLVPKLTPDQYKLLLYMEQYYWRRGGIPTYEQMKAEGTNVEEEFYLESWSNGKFVNSLRARGLPEHLLVTDSGTLNGKVLTEEQMTVANVLLNMLDKRSRIKKLTELGVTQATYNQWLKDPVYRNYCLERSEQMIQENQPDVTLALINRATSGDLGAIKYFNALSGRYAEDHSGVTVNIGGTEDRQQLIEIVEIIQRHVKDPEVLEAIGRDILESRAQQTEPRINQVKPFTRGALQR